jgi:hypothetical protein
LSRKDQCSYQNCLNPAESISNAEMRDAFSWIEAILVAALIFSGQFAAK